MRVFLFGLLSFFLLPVFGQHTPVLERTVTLQLENKKMIDVLDEMERQASFSFSYNANLVDENRLVSVRANKRPIREVLKKLFDESVQVRERKNYLILSKAQPSEKKVVVGGYVQTPDGRPVKGATVYDENTLASANTNQYGYYEMKIERSNSQLLRVSKDEFHDTIAPLKPHGGALQNIILQPEKQDTTWRGRLNAWSDSTAVFFGKLTNEIHLDSLFPERRDSVERAMRDSIRSVRQRNFLDSAKAGWSDFKQWILADSIRNENVRDTIYRRAQLSLLPYIGTNRKMSPYCVNDFSFNLLGGYNRGSRMLELGAFANIDRESVGGVQLAGFANIVGGNVSGFQAAGFANVNKGNTTGAQLAGFTNVNLGKTEGLVLSGFSNVFLGDAHGVFASGFANVVRGNANGLQMAGFANIAAQNLEGLQVSGFLNCAKNMHGSQIGIINISDSLSGVAIGIFNFVRKGYHTLELSANDIFYANASLRSGVRSFYTMINAGVKPNRTLSNGNPMWTVGYGAGTSPRITKWLYLNLDLMANYVVMDVHKPSPIDVTFIERVKPFEYLSLDNQFYLGAEVRVSKRFGITGGAVLHGWLTEKKYVYQNFFNDTQPTFVENTNMDNLNLKMWWGWKVGLRIF